MTGTPTWFGPIRQTAFVVSDIEAGINRWIDETGTGPWFVFDVYVPDSIYRGQTLPTRLRAALAQSGTQQIELIQPNLSEDSAFKEFVDAGHTGIHHIAYWVDPDEAHKHLEANGNELVQSGATSAGNKYTYWSSSVGVPYIEFIHPQPGDQISAFFAKVAAAADGWDGSNPIRGR